MRLVLVLLVIGCSGDLELAEDASPVDATTAANLEDAHMPVTPGKILFIGDSIVKGSYDNGGATVLRNAGWTVVNISSGGVSPAAQYTTWLASAFRGDPTITHIFMMEGVNGLGAGLASVQATMAAHIADIRAQNPNATLVLATMTPMKTYAGMSAGNYSAYYLPLNAWLVATYGARTDINVDFDDGAGALKAIYDSGDHLHPNNTGYIREGTDLLAILSEEPANDDGELGAVAGGDQVEAAARSGK